MAAIDVKTYALTRHYTDETAAQFGGLKGASCTIKSIEKQNGINVVTFEWKNNKGETRESVMKLYDGTPIYTWQSGDHYEYGDLVIYQSCFYRCITPNSDVEFDDRKWNEIGSPDGNYDIVQNSELLPPIYTAADRKMYYSIDENIFYLWDGYSWVPQHQVVQYVVMPTAKRIFRGRIVQYIGETTSDYHNGYFYKCTLENETYVWSNIEVEPPIEPLTAQQLETIFNILN